MGMFVHKLEGSWLKHPFWKTKFVLEDEGTLMDLREADIDGVVIDISKGCDVMTRPQAQAAAPRTAANSTTPAPAQRRRFTPPSAPAQFDYASTAPQSTAREFGHAAKVVERSRKVVSKVFLQAAWARRSRPRRSNR